MTGSRESPALNAFSVDVEEHFQVAALASRIEKGQWDTCPSRVENNTRRCIELLSDASVRGTFFVLGWVAKRYPTLVREIAQAGHEVACHGMEHDRVIELGRERFKADVIAARSLLQDILGGDVAGYRAPSFSLAPNVEWAYVALMEAGFRYSSSVYPVQHDHYGTPDSPRSPYRPVVGAHFLEFPMSTVRLVGRNVPVSGGGYFRLFPYALSAMLLRWSGAKAKGRRIFYVHPWEVDPGQPAVGGLPYRSRFRHYVSLARTEGRLRMLLRDFRWDRMDCVFASELANPAEVPTYQGA